MNLSTTSNADLLRQRMLGGGPGLPPALANHPTQSSIAIDGWKSVTFGLPFFLAGVAIECAALNTIPSHKNAPDWLIALVGSFFLLAGAFLIAHGLRGVIRTVEHNRESTAHPGEPWLSDNHWNRLGSSYSAFNEMVRRLLAAIGWNAFLVPFFWVGLNQRGAGRVFLVFASLFALLGLIFWARWARTLLDFLRHGNSTLAFDSFPYFLGGTLSARLEAPRHFDALTELALTLRCVQEKYVTTGSGNNRSTKVVCFELYKDTLSFSQGQFAGAATSSLPFSFRLPHDQSPTCLTDTPPTYWEIEARGKASGADYEAYFLVPVYSPR